MLFLKHTCICNLYATIDLLIYHCSLQFIKKEEKKKDYCYPVFNLHSSIKIGPLVRITFIRKNKLKKSSTVN